MDVSTTIDAYQKHLKAAGYAAATIAGYQKYLDQFRHYLQSRHINDLRKVTHQTICDYQHSVAAEPVAPETKALKIRPVKRLFEHLCARHRLLINPAEGIVEISRKKRLVGPVLSQGQMQRLLTQPKGRSAASLRNRAIMHVLYSSAVRISELVALEIDDANLKAKELYIRKGKGGRGRVAPLGQRAAGHLEAYLAKARPEFIGKGPPRRALFVSRTGERLSANSVRAFLTRYRKAAGIKVPVSPHMLRRSCATHLLQQGADIRHIQQLLGHQRLSSTQAYTKVMPVDLKATHERTHPRL